MLLTGVWQDNRRTAAIVLAVLLLLSLALYPRLRGPGVPAGPEPAPELREGEPPRTTGVHGNVGEPQPPRGSTDAPSHRRR
jgi:putative amide transporter protein